MSRSLIAAVLIGMGLLAAPAGNPQARGASAGIGGVPSASGTPVRSQVWQLPGGPTCAIQTPWPGRVAVAAPDLALDPALAGFLGVWEGYWGGFASRLAFNSVDPVAANGIYAYPMQSGAPAAAFATFAGKISGHTITWAAQGAAAATFTFTISDDGSAIVGQRTAPNGSSVTATLSRCSSPSTYVPAPQPGGAVVIASAGFMSLPAGAAAGDAGVVDNMGAVEGQGAVRSQTINSPVIGTVFEPTQVAGPLPAVLLLHGSEGYDVRSGPNGLQATAEHLAAQGFVTLSLCYFGCDGRPSVLQRIALEYVFSAVQYLEGLPEVDSSYVSVLGLSRGAELALIVGANRPELRSVIALYGSPYYEGAVGNKNPIADCAWTLNDQCVAAYGTLLQIPVQQIRGPVLLLHGLDDSLWPSGFSQTIADELETAGHQYQLTLFPGVGHGFGLMGCIMGMSSCRPLDDGTRVFGPANRANYVNASRVTFAQTVAFLNALR
ncbi:MAG TPA: acyl-CoA thioester hydrolase/BAAT C-terminal domain-containing protein [Dehalococcoidia bacterium]|nr:acyl-CoA thioester hydrolase/BAAT C-terminal domain-containing protein [Dehalococcoidia bacterium]